MAKDSKRRYPPCFSAIALCLMSPSAWANPCDDVLERAEQAADLDEAQFILGGCLAAPGPAHVQLQAAHALLLLAEGDELACRYVEIIQLMLEANLPELDADILTQIADDAESHARHCDQK